MDRSWRRPFELAWDSLQAGSYPVGAVLLDAAGEVVVEGRNRAAEESAPAGHLFGTTIAHAEVDVLGRLRAGDYSDWTLHTTLQPCLFCLSASRLAGIGRIVFAGADPLWDATAGVPGLLPDLLSSRWPVSTGPADGMDGVWGSLLPAIWLVRYKPEVVAEPSDLIPWPMVKLARICVDAGILESASAAEAYRLAGSVG